MKLYSKYLLSVAIGMLGTQALAGDLSHYPYESFAYAGKYLNSIINEKTNAALALYVDFDFLNSQNELIKKAVTIFAERYVSKPVVDCAFDNSSKDILFKREEFVPLLKEAIGAKKLDDARFPTYLFIARYDGEIDSTARGFLNLYFDNDRPFPGYPDRHYLYIALNNVYVGDSKTYFGKDPEFWAGTIGHEILHNLNYDHKTGYSGSFIYEYGKCLWKNGTQGNIPDGIMVDETVMRGL